MAAVTAVAVARCATAAGSAAEAAVAVAVIISGCLAAIKAGSCTVTDESKLLAQLCSCHCCLQNVVWLADGQTCPQHFSAAQQQ